MVKIRSWFLLRGSAWLAALMLATAASACAEPSGSRQPQSAPSPETESSPSVLSTSNTQDKESKLPTKINEAVKVARRSLMEELGWKAEDDIRISTLCGKGMESKTEPDCRWDRRQVTFYAYKTYEGDDPQVVHLEFRRGHWALKNIREASEG